MRVKIKPNFDPLDFERNPLVDSEFKIVVRKFKDGSWTTDKGNKVHQLKEIELEQDRFTKVYTRPEARKSVAMLSPAAKSLLIWIIFELEPAQDWLWINSQRYMDENCLSSVNTYKTAVEELCRCLFIYAALSKYKDTYWINPRLLFCGSRINKYPNNIEYK